MNNLNTAVNKLMGRDVSRDVSAIADTRAALGAAWSVQQQVLMSNNWQRLPLWLQTKNGADTARLIADEFGAYLESAKSPSPNP